jgi:phosphatidate cytidylyltransferase
MKKEVLKRIPTGIVLLAFIAFGTYFFPSPLACLVLLVIVALSLREFYLMLDQMNIPSFKFFGITFGILMVIGTWLELVVYSLPPIHNFLLALIVVVVFLRQFPQKHNGKPLITIASTLLGVFFIAFLLNYLTRLLFTWQPPAFSEPISSTGRYLLFYLVGVVKVSDIGAYIIGKKIGRHKMFARISPAKTWEGCAGGIFFGFVTSLLFLWFAVSKELCINFSLLSAIILGLGLPALGVLGDLCESMLKRAASVKDSGQLMPGLGGVMDTVDSILFAAPALYMYAYIVMTPVIN